VRLISLIGFPDDIGGDLAAFLARHGCHTIRHESAHELPNAPAAVFISGDRARWLETICHVRGTHSRVFIVFATRLPDHEKWLDALDAGANDYCCLPLDGQQFAWLFRRDAQPHRAETMGAFRAS